MKNNIKFDWDDILVVPKHTSPIRSRKEIIVNRLPLYVSPMDTVVDEENAKEFYDNGYEVCLPRHINYTRELNFCFFSYGLSEIKKILDESLILSERKVLIDIANGNMVELLDVIKKFKSIYPNKTLMVGNVANPITYKNLSEAGADIIRVGVGNGSGCLTTEQTGIGYPMGSLIEECREIKNKFNLKSKILADGGFRKYSDIIKSLAVGSDGVMLGGMLNKCIESCSENYIKEGDSFHIISKDEAKDKITLEIPVYKYYRGMSTKEVQRDWGRTDLQTSEGISKYNKVEYTLSGWTENFKDYLRTNMSYCGSLTLDEFIGKVEYIMVTQNAFNRYNK